MYQIANSLKHRQKFYKLKKEEAEKLLADSADDVEIVNPRHKILTLSADPSYTCEQQDH